MKLNEWQLLALVVGAFVAVIVVDIALQYQGNENFRQSFPLKFAQSRAPQMIQQEMNVQPPGPPSIVDEGNSSEEE